MKEKIYELKRNLLKRKLTNNLGKVVETEDKLICYVDKKNIKKEKYHYTIACFGLMIKDKIQANFYNLNKPIIYIIDGIEIKNKRIYIFGYRNCEVIIKNCSFDFDLCVRINGTCTIENTFIKAFNLLTIYADELILKNMNIKNELPYSVKKFIIGINSNKKLEINNSTIGDRTSEVNIEAGESLHIYNSNIVGNKINCKANHIVSGKKSNLSGAKEVKLETKSFYEINITSPTINYNGVTYSNLTKPVTLKKVVSDLKLKRLKLLSYLNQIKEICNQKNKDDIKEYQSKLNNKPITKVLSK